MSISSIAPFATLLACWGFEFNGQIYHSIADMVGTDSPFQSSQEDINRGRLEAYTDKMSAGDWDWNNMRSLDVKGQIVDDRIEAGRTPSGRFVLKNGHHRYVAARLTGTPIPPEAIQWTNWLSEPKVYPWNRMTLMLFDPQGFYPVLAPPPRKR